MVIRGQGSGETRSLAMLTRRRSWYNGAVNAAPGSARFDLWSAGRFSFANGAADLADAATIERCRACEHAVRCWRQPHRFCTYARCGCRLKQKTRWVGKGCPEGEVVRAYRAEGVVGWRVSARTP